MKRLTADQAKLGFIGLGNMGSRIAHRLLDHGYHLTAYDIDAAKAQAIVAKGGVFAKNIPELAQSADVILSCLTNDEAAESVYTDPEGIFAVARPGTVVLEMSTISPESLTRTAPARRQASASRSWMLPSPAARLPPSKVPSRCWPAATGSSSARLSQSSRRLQNNPFLSAIPALEPTMKLVVNSLLGVGMQAIAEAVVLGEKAGLDRDRLLEVLAKDSRGRSGPCGKAGEDGDQRLQSAVSLAADAQGFSVDSG